MSLVFTDYTSFDIVRGLLGVAEEEITDAVFTTLSNTALQEVTFTLEELNTTIPAQFETVKDVSPTTSRSTQQQRFYDIVQLYAAYIVAAWIANGAIEMFAPIQITDSKAQMVRKDDPYTDLRMALQASLALWKARLGTALTALDPTQIVTPVIASLVGSSALGTDPVTGA